MDNFGSGAAAAPAAGGSGAEASAWSGPWSITVVIEPDHDHSPRHPTQGPALTMGESGAATTTTPSLPTVAMSVAAFHQAAADGSVATVKAAVDANPGLALAADPQTRWTALHQAAKTGRREVCAVLLNAGSNITATTQHESSALHLAACHGQRGVAELLLQRGCPLEMMDNKLNTALLRAAQHGALDVFVLLQKAGADMNVVNVEGLGIDERIMAIEDDSQRAAFLELITAGGSDGAVPPGVAPPPTEGLSSAAAAAAAVQPAPAPAPAAVTDAVRGAGAAAPTGVGRWYPGEVRAHPEAVYAVFDEAGIGQIFPNTFTFAARRNKLVSHVTEAGVEQQREHSLYEDIEVFGLLDTEKKAALTKEEFCAAVRQCEHARVLQYLGRHVHAHEVARGMPPPAPEAAAVAGPPEGGSVPAAIVEPAVAAPMTTTTTTTTTNATTLATTLATPSPAPTAATPWPPPGDSSTAVRVVVSVAPSDTLATLLVKAKTEYAEGLARARRGPGQEGELGAAAPSPSMTLVGIKDPAAGLGGAVVGGGSNCARPLPLTLKVRGWEGVRGGGGKGTGRERGTCLSLGRPLRSLTSSPQQRSLRPFPPPTLPQPPACTPLSVPAPTPPTPPSRAPAPSRHAKVKDKLSPGSTVHAVVVSQARADAAAEAQQVQAKALTDRVVAQEQRLRAQVGKVEF